MDTKKIDLIGDNHEFFSLDTPLRPDAFRKSNDEKINFNKFTFPTLIITGEKDINSTPRMSMKLHKEIKNSQIKIIKSMKHMAYYEKSKLVNLEIKNFLK